MDVLTEIALKFNMHNYRIYRVGGSVRDTIIGRPVKDIDLTTDAKPDAIKELVDEFGTLYTVGERFGTIGVETAIGPIEITTFRGEQYSEHSRKPEVCFGTNLIEDLARRDFTMNAIAIDLWTGIMHDPFGGVSDILKKVVRCVGNDDDRFQEDPLRMMRAIRFACQLEFKLNVEMLNPQRIMIVSKERVTEEFNKIIMSDRAAEGIQMLCNFGLMHYIMPEFTALKNIAQGKNHFKDVHDHSLLVLDKGTRVNASKPLVFRLACFFHDIGKPDTKTEDETGVHFYMHHMRGADKTAAIMKRMMYDNDTIANVVTLVKNHMNPLILRESVEDGSIKKRTIIRMIREVGEENIDMLLELVKCDIRSSASPRYAFMNALIKLFKEVVQEEEPSKITAPINGDEIRGKLNIKPCKLIGEIKQFLTNQVIDGTLNKDDKEGAYRMMFEFLESKDIGKKEYGSSGDKV